MDALDGEAAVDLGDAGELLASGRAVVTVTRDQCPDVAESLEVLIVRTRRGLFAVESRCPHALRPLGDANVRGRGVRCAGHGRRFDLRTGAQRPARRGCLRTFDVRVEGGRLLLAVR